jgi:hypothetical protein
MYPPPGACRVWVDGVPPERQPPPLDCAAAERSVPANGRVVFGVMARRPEELGVVAGGVDRRPEGGIDRRPTPADATPLDPEATAGPRPTEGCPDADRDAWCDDVRLPATTPRRRPRMVSALLYRRFGQAVQDVNEWIGVQGMQLRYVDGNRDNVPERVLWLDRRGAPIQIWEDVNGDGYADRIGAYRGGQLVRVLGGR